MKTKLYDEKTSLNDPKTHTKSFINGAFILGIAGLVAKLLGAVFRIPLGTMLTPEEMSYFTNAYSLFTFIAVIATTGIPIAMAQSISENREHIEKQMMIMKSMKISIFSIGLVASTGLFLFAGQIAHMIGNPMAKNAIMALSPGIFFVCLMSVYRGYYQGLQQMSYYGWSQVIDQVSKVIVGLLLAYILVMHQSVYAPAGATFGVTIGSLVGFIYLYVSHRKNNLLKSDRQITFDKAIVIKIIKFAIPVTIGVAIWPLVNAIDTFFVINRLVYAGFGEYANDLLGILGGYVLSIVNLPLAISSAIQLSIVPSVVYLYKQNSHEKLHEIAEKGIKMVSIIILPASVGFITLGKEIFILLYPSRPEIYEVAGHLLAIIGFGLIFLSIYQVSSGILQGIGYPKVPAKNMLISSLVKIILVYILCGISSVNIYGAAISTVITFFVAVVLNVQALKKIMHLKINWISIIGRPLIVATSMGLLVMMIKNLPIIIKLDRFGIVLTVISAVLFYGFLCLKTKVVTPEDLSAIKGNKKESKKLEYS